ncbi:hypothetical protein ACHAW6_012114 [Cyclotella cf. meneghiniana]
MPVAATTVGMAWGASRGDPSSEVARFAGEFVKELFPMGNSQNLSSVRAPSTVRLAVLHYSSLVLGCKRASALQDVINPVSFSPNANSENQTDEKDKKDKGQKSTKSMDSAAAVSELEREEMEERYERVVLSVLIGLGSLVECEPENEKSQHYATDESFLDASTVVRLMQSSRGSFRRECYNLVGKFCQFAPSLVMPPADETAWSSKLISLATLIPNLLSSEKDPSNFVSLLELILTYLSVLRGLESAGREENTNPWESIDASTFTKSLSKALRRACCGAPAANWGPMILPIVATLPQGEVEKGEKTDHPFALVVVEGLWEGRKSAVGAMDTAAILSSVAECVTYLMLRRPSNSGTTFTIESWTACGQFFLDCLSHFLNESPDSGFGPGASSLDELCTTIARDLTRLDAASVDDGTNDRGITQIKSFLWSDNGIQKTLLSTKRERRTDQKLIRLMRNIMSLTENTEQRSSHLMPSIKALFSEVLVYSDSRDNKSCTKEEVELILNIIQFCGAQTLFPIQKATVVHSDANQNSLSLEQFCVNNLIRWILIHAKALPAAIPTDFTIGKWLLLSIQPLHQQRQVWETILRELIKAYCDVSTLATGLCAMASENGKSYADLIRCRTLDQFAIEVSSTVMDNFRRSHDLSHQPDDSDEPVVSYQGDMSFFFNTCVGMFDRKSILVSSSVIRHWVSLCCYESKSDRLILDDDEGSNSLLKTLLLLGTYSEHVLTRDELVKLVIQSWIEGGLIWHQAVKDYNLMVDSGDEQRLMRDEIISAASLLLKEDIRRKPPSDHAVMELTCQSWSNKAVRLLDILKTGSLQNIGIDVDLCEKIRQRNDAEFLFLTLMYLLHSVDSSTRCRELLLSGSTNQELFVKIHSSIADPDNTLLQSFQHRTRRNTQLVDILGGATALTEFVQNCVVQCVDLLASYMKADERVACNQTLTALSCLVSILFPSKLSIVSGGDDSIFAEDVKEGDSVWYEKAEGVRVKATIVKVHTDDFPNLYFTIKEENSQERQTVPNRLRRNPVDSCKVQLNEDNATNREVMGRYILDRLVTPFIPKLHIHADLSIQNEVSAECISIVLSQIGVLSFGIGSVRYEIFQIVSSLERSLCEVIRNFNQHLEQASSILRFIALAMGYGRFTLSSVRGNFADLNLSTDGIFTCLLDLYDDHSSLLRERTTPMKSFHLSVVMWLAVATNEVRLGDILQRLSALIFFICDVLLPDHDADSSMILMKTIIAFQDASKKCIDYSSVDSAHEKLVFEKITRCFVSMQKASTSWVETYAQILKHYVKEVPGIVLHAASTFSDDLYGCLRFPMKRWCAFQLLMLRAKGIKSINSLENVAIPPSTEVLLLDWKADLDEEEAFELESDVRVASSWLSGTMMTLLQDIGQCTASSLTKYERDTIKLGEILVWVLFLEIFDNAGAIDMRNRSSISALLQKTKATGTMMNLTLQEADLDIGRKENIFECISPDCNGDFVLREVATLAVFRTIESLPTLVKSWFNDECPRYSQHKLITFVENKVAPETLQRELARIKDATSFGDMSVSGSTVSREVVATYQQDECQLSVTIRIPSTFPLRNVEVDCQKTLGIAEKRWRRWALNIMMMLNNQDGSILDALLLWKENVDKEFDGVEPCPVCYSVLCIKTHSMPNLQCKTCNNRFHSLCLHKWFHSSGKSNCVLCQQPWSGIKVA